MFVPTLPGFRLPPFFLNEVKLLLYIARCNNDLTPLQVCLGIFDIKKLSKRG
jgi:hypothetical protein